MAGLEHHCELHDDGSLTGWVSGNPGIADFDVAFLKLLETYSNHELCSKRVKAMALAKWLMP